jgi:hypothetical protein
MYENVRKEIAKLAEELPKGYGTFDADGKPVIVSQLDGLDWFAWAMNLLQSKGHQKEKELLRAQLSRSTGDDNAGGRIYELIAALDAGPADSHREDRLVKPFGKKIQAFNA